MSWCVVLFALLSACSTSEEAPAPADPVEAPAKAKAEAEAPAKAEEAGDAEGWQSYGADFTKKKSMPATKLLDEPSTYVDQVVMVEGRVADVCAKAGCWMVLAEGDKSMRVVMKDHFAVDKEGTGGTAVVEGTVIAKAVDPETVAHYKSESRKPELVPEEGKETAYELVATAVRMRR